MIRQSVLRRELASGQPLTEEVTVIVIAEPLEWDEFFDLEGGSEAEDFYSEAATASVGAVAPPSISLDELLQMELARPRVIDLADAILRSLFRTDARLQHPSMLFRGEPPFAQFDIVAEATRICQEHPG